MYAVKAIYDGNNGTLDEILNHQDLNVITGPLLSFL
jgi:hypothetical protein